MTQKAQTHKPVPTVTSLMQGSVLQRKCACGNHTNGDGGCKECRKKQLSLQRKTTTSFQPKLVVNQPYDKYEQEADRVADQIMRMPEQGVQRQCDLEESVNGQLHTKPMLQRRTEGNSISEAPPIVHAVLRSPGQPLDTETRAFMEPRFGHDFSQVRVHKDVKAVNSAQAVNAQAYTVGRNVVFGAGHYLPGTRSGRQLLAHELTHVLQQTQGLVQRRHWASPDLLSLKDGTSHVKRTIPSEGQEITVQETSSHYLARNGEGAKIHPSSVSLVSLSCGTDTLDFYTDAGVFSYVLDNCDLSDGEYTANVVVQDNNVEFDLGEDVTAGTRFNFSYRVEPDQPNPSTFFQGQQVVRIVANSGIGESEDGPTILAELPIVFVGDILAPDSSPEGLPGFPTTTMGLSLHVLASGDLSWLESGDAARRVLSRRYWSPLIPSRGTVPLDRLLDELPRDLAPRIETELAQGNRLSWIRRGFTESELRNIPELVRRLNTRGMGSLTARELEVLMQAANLHVGGSSPGTPFVSFTRPGADAPDLEFLSNRRYRVRVEVPQSAALDVSQSTSFTREAASRGFRELPNISEAEFLVTANHRGRVVSVQRLSGSTESSFLIRHSGKLRWGGRVLFVAGLAVSGARIAEASPEERGVVIAEEAGGQVGGALGTGLAVAGCALFGIATGGVGLFICGLGGGIAGGLIGSSVGGEFARGTSEGRDDSPCPSCHAMQREWETQLNSFHSLELGGRGTDLPGAPLSPQSGVAGTELMTTEELEVIRRWINSVEIDSVEHEENQ